MIFVPFLDSGPPCTGGTTGSLGPGSCLYDEWGLALLNNTFAHNGSYGHPTNGDFAQLNFESGHPTDCYSGNTETGGGAVTSSRRTSSRPIRAATARPHRRTRTRRS